MNPNKYYIMDALAWDPGFFCCYQSAVGFLDFCEQEQPMGFEIFWERGLYFDEKVGPNWWEYYFEPVKVGEMKEGDNVEHIGDSPKSHWNTHVISDMSRERACEIIQKYIKLKPYLKNKIDQFCDLYINNRYVIGIHFRGSDKSSESPRVAFSVVKDEILKVINGRSDYTIFVATDEQGFINYMTEKFGNKIVYNFDAIRSQDNSPIHHFEGKPMNDPYKLGLDAVIDSYLLSKTNIMIRTQSNLSSSAANINPNLRVINLNKTKLNKPLR